MVHDPLAALETGGVSPVCSASLRHRPALYLRDVSVALQLSSHFDVSSRVGVGKRLDSKGIPPLFVEAGERLIPVNGTCWRLQRGRISPGESGGFPVAPPGIESSSACRLQCGPADLAGNGCIPEPANGDH